MQNSVVVPQLISAIWKAAFNLAKASFSKIWFWLLLHVLLSVLNVALAQHFYKTIDPRALAIAIIVAMEIIFYLILYYLYGVIFLRIADVHVNNIQPLSVVFQSSLLKLPKMFVVSLLGLIMVFLGTLALLIPGIYFAIVAWLLPAVVYMENKTIIETIKYAIIIVWDNWWRTFGAFVIPIAIFQICIAITSKALTGAVISSNSFSAQVPLGYKIITIVFDYIFMLYLISLILIQFKDLKARKQLQATSDIKNISNN